MSAQQAESLCTIRGADPLGPPACVLATPRGDTPHPASNLVKTRTRRKEWRRPVATLVLPSSESTQGSRLGNRIMRCHAQIAPPTPLKIVCNLMSRSLLREFGFVRPILRSERTPVTGRSLRGPTHSLYPPRGDHPGNTRIAAPTPRKISCNRLPSQPVIQNWFRMFSLAFRIRGGESTRSHGRKGRIQGKRSGADLLVPRAAVL